MKTTTQQKQSPAPSKPKSLLWMAGLGLAAVGVILLFANLRSPSKPPVESPSVPSPAASPAPVAISQERLLGRWVRPDGGYVLEFRRIELSGRMEAAYFNPNPIHVARAEWRRDEDRLEVFVELRDVNYPGSTYKLTYLPAQEMLKGTYFQAATGESYEIEFVRMRDN